MPFLLSRYDHRFCIQLIKYPAYILFILFSVKGAGTIDEDATRIQTFPRVCYNLTLQSPAFFNVLQTPFADGGRILAEHPLARAWNVAEDDVKMCLCLSKVTGIVVGDDCLWPAPFRDVLQ